MLRMNDEKNRKKIKFVCVHCNPSPHLQPNFFFLFWWGVPSNCYSATQKHAKGPIASFCGRLSPLRNKFNIV